MQSAFIDNWTQATGDVLHGKAHLPDLGPTGSATAQVFTSSPGGILPGPHMDVPLVRRASRAGWGELLAACAEIHEYQPTMYHCKVMIVDRLWVSVGSTNFDTRSFSINEQDLKRSRRVTLQEWESRSWLDKSLDFAASTLSAQL